MLKCLFPKRRRASLATGKFVLFDLPQKAIKKIVLYIAELKISCKNLIFY